MKNARQKKLGLIISAILSVQVVYAQPNGAQVVQGSASISTPNSNTMNITNSNNAVINWQQFNIGAGQTTNFIQPSSSSSVLNRVISNAPSQILGNLNSNGQVFLINQNGILVGDGARINTNGFFASTLNITNEDYLNGNLKFTGGANGAIENQGYIHAGENGNIVLIAPNIENGGVIEVDNGNIILAAGESITITSLDNSSVEFQVQSAEHQITNLGSVIAKNGAANLFAGTLKHTGLIRATGLVRDENGIIRLVALDKNEVSGSVDVSGDSAGYIEVLGDNIDIQQGANINASSNAVAGEILIGGDQQGLNPNVKNAISTTIAEGAQIHADGIEQGDGGKVIVFAKNDVHIQGEITAKGGNVLGDGGFIETSGLKQLDITAVPDASAVNGAAGEWLIDPNNITIQAAGSDTNTTGVIDTSNDGAILTTATIVTALESGINVTISTGVAGANTELGDITINDAIAPIGSTLGNLALNAHNDINVNADIGTGVITLTADSDANGFGDINLGNSTLNTEFNNLTGFNNLTLSGNAINVIGNTAISNSNSQVTLNAPLTIIAAANLTFLNTGFVNSTTVNNIGGITNNGTITIRNTCGDLCSKVAISGVIDNNGIIDFKGGELVSMGTLNLNAGTVLTAISPSGVIYNRLTAAGTLNPNVNIITDVDLQLGLSNGTINNFENIKIFNNFVIDGGTINFGTDINLPQSVTTFIDNISGVLTLNAPTTGAYFTLNGRTNFSINKGYFDIALVNTHLINGSDWSVNGFVSATGVSPNITGNANSSFNLLNDSRLIFNAPLSHTISVPVISQGTIELANASSNLSFTGAGGLTLKNGGRLSGIGTYIGNVIVDSGGQISPGLYGNTRDNTGILNITGNVVFNQGSIGIWEIDDDGINFDQLNVIGNVDLTANPTVFLFWDTLAVATPILQGPFDLITATGIITAASLSQNLNDLPGVTTGINPFAISATTVNSLVYTPGTIGAINHWTGLSTIAPASWNDPANWFSAAAPTVPTQGQTLVVEAAITIDLSVATASLGDVQLDANLNINAGGSLNGTGVLSNLQDIRLLTSTSDVSGTGAWNNLSAVFADDAITISRDTFNNYGGFHWNTPTNTIADLVFTGINFNNRGTVNFAPLNNGNVVDFSGSTNGLNNQGLTVFNIGSSSTSFTGTLNNASNGVLSIVSPNPNPNPTLILGTSNTNNGEIFLKDTVFALNNGVTFTLATTSRLNGVGTYKIGTGSILLANNMTFGNGLTVDLSGGTLGITSSTIINDKFNWSSGTLNGTGVLTTGSSSITQLGSSVDATMTGVNWTNNGHVDWISSGGDFVINNSTFTNNAQGVFSVQTTSNLADIIGTNGIFNNTGLFEINANATAINTAIGVQFNHNISQAQSVLDLGVSGHTLSLSGNSSLSGAISIAAGSTLSFSGATTQINVGASFTGLGDIVSTASLVIADSVAITPFLKVNSGIVNFEGAATLTDLNLVSGTINVDTLGASSTGDTLTVSNLKWGSGVIAGDGSANLVITGTSVLVTGTLQNINWTNIGSLTWSDLSAANLTLDNANFTNAASGVFDINNVNVFFGGLFGSVIDGVSNKSITSTNGTFINEGTINLVNATLDLNGGTLNLDTSTAVLNGSGLLIGNVNNSAGTVSMSLDRTAGSLRIDGNYFQGANGTMKVRVVDPVNGQFQYDTFGVNGLAKLGGTLELEYFSNQIASVTKSFNPFIFSNRNGIFDTLVDTNGNILAIDISNGGFTILGVANSFAAESSAIEVVKNQEDLKEILKIIEGDGDDETLDFIKEILANQNDENKKKRKKKRAKKLVCK